MKTFCSIIQQQIESCTNIFLPDDTNDFNTQIINNKKNESNNLIVNLFHTYMTGIFYNTHKFTCKNKKFITICKFKELHKILNNIFIPNQYKEEFLIIFSKIQRTYYAFSRLANIFKYKNASLQISSDLFMNDIKETDANVFTIIQNNSKYLFVISDLINIINNNLFNSVYFFPEPLISKNPYNNIPFNTSTLYNIYFYIRFNICVMPDLIQGYFLSKFDFDDFEYNYEGLIRETYIKSYIYTTPYSTLYDDVIDMIEIHNIYKKKLHIHEDFHEEILVNIMRPYLHLYYLSKYYIVGSCKKRGSGILLKKKFRLFIEFNPLFGRKNVTLVKKRYNPNVVVKQNISFNTKHVNFNNIDYDVDDVDEEQEPEIIFNFINNAMIVDNELLQLPHSDISMNHDSEEDTDEDDDDDDDDDEYEVEIDDSSILNVFVQPLLLYSENMEEDEDEDEDEDKEEGEIIEDKYIAEEKDVRGYNGAESVVKRSVAEGEGEGEGEGERMESIGGSRRILEYSAEEKEYTRETKEEL